MCSNQRSVKTLGLLCVVAACATSRSGVTQTYEMPNVRRSSDHNTDRSARDRSAYTHLGSTAEILYAISGSNNLYRIVNHAASPEAVNIGDTGLLLWDLAIDLTTGLSFGITPGSELYSIDLQSGAATLIGETGVSSQKALDFSSDGILYSWGSDTLYEIDPGTGLATFVMDIFFSPAGDLASDPTDGSLYGAANGGILIRIDLETSQVTVIGSHGLGSIFGLEIDAAGTLFAGDHLSPEESRLYVLDKSTAAATLIGAIAGSLELGGVYGLALSGALCPWDSDGSGGVGILDLLVLLAAWGSDPGGPPDFDGDGTVGILDLLILLANWGPCP